MLRSDDGGAVLTVRKRGARRFMVPGGKPEPGESAAQAAIRKCAEELDARLDPSLLRPLGVFRAAAANEPDHAVKATVFEHPSAASASQASGRRHAQVSGRAVATSRDGDPGRRTSIAALQLRRLPGASSFLQMQLV